MYILAWPLSALSLQRSFLHHLRFQQEQGCHQWTLNQPSGCPCNLMLTSLVSVMTLTPWLMNQCIPQMRRRMEQMLTSYLLRPVLVSFSREWSMLASDGQSDFQIDVLCRVRPCLHPPGNHHPHRALQDTDELDTPKDVSMHHDSATEDVLFLYAHGIQWESPQRLHQDIQLRIIKNAAALAPESRGDDFSSRKASLNVSSSSNLWWPSLTFFLVCATDTPNK